jgi:outer membrane protein TolC
MKLSYIRWTVFFSVFFTVLTVTAQERHQLSVQQAVDYARKNSVAVKNALIGIQLQKQQNREITAAAFPQINGNMGANYNPNVTVQQFPNFIAAATYGVLESEGVKNGSGSNIVSPSDFGLIAAAFGTKFNANYGVSLDQLLFDGQVFVGLMARKTSIDYATKNVEVTEENIKANIYKIYYQLSAGKEQLRILDANIALLTRLRDDNQKMFENGFAEKLDVNRASVQLANVETQRTKALNTIQNGYLGLKLLMGMPIKDSVILTDSVTYENIKDGVLENTAYNYADRKEYQLADLGKKLREFDIRRYKLTKAPTVSLSSNYSRISQSNKFNFFGGAKWFPSSSIGLSISIPIFDGFARSARIEQARLRLQQTQNDIENLKLTIDKDVNQGLNDYRTALQTLDNQKRNIDLAQLVYNQAKLKYEQGLGSTLEITSAQNDLQVAQSNYILSLYDAINAKVDFLKATGKL